MRNKKQNKLKNKMQEHFHKYCKDFIKDDVKQIKSIDDKEQYREGFLSYFTNEIYTECEYDNTHFKNGYKRAEDCLHQWELFDGF